MPDKWDRCYLRWFRMQQLILFTQAAFNICLLGLCCMFLPPVSYGQYYQIMPGIFLGYDKYIR
jgi:hypothetical protein